jgi:hypothetical protein
MTHSFDSSGRQDPDVQFATAEDADEFGNTASDDVSDLDVDAPDADEAEDTVAEGTEAAPTDKPAAKAKKESTRPPVPEGLVSPVQFAKLLTEHKIKNGTLEEGKVIAPQVVYSYIKNNMGEGAKYPFPARTDVPGRALVLDPAEGLAWWDAKDARVKAQKTAKAQKDAAKANAAQTSPQAAAETGEVATGPVEEAE